jgi:(p)ppGpp synthase/HD superfamily hydrolase
MQTNSLPSLAEPEVFTTADALQLATTAHAGQVDKAGNPYIGHPIRVADRLTSADEKIVALLHDIIEDTSQTALTLRAAGVSDIQIEAIVALTKQPGESLARSMQRVRSNPLALKVKLADIEDNCDPARLQLLSPEQVTRLTLKYEQSRKYLLE